MSFDSVLVKCMTYPNLSLFLIPPVFLCDVPILTLRVLSRHGHFTDVFAMITSSLLVCGTNFTCAKCILHRLSVPQRVSPHHTVPSSGNPRSCYRSAVKWSVLCWSVSSPGSFFQVGGEYRTWDRMLWFSSVAAGTYLECFLSHLLVFFHFSPTTPWLLPLTSSRFLSLILTILYLMCQGRCKRAVKSTRKLIEPFFRESVNRHLLYDISGSHGCKICALRSSGL